MGTFGSSTRADLNKGVKGGEIPSNKGRLPHFSTRGFFLGEFLLMLVREMGVVGLGVASLVLGQAPGMKWLPNTVGTMAAGRLKSA